MVTRLVKEMESVTESGKCIDEYTLGESNDILGKLKTANQTIYYYNWRWYLLFVVSFLESIGFLAYFIKSDVLKIRGA